MEQQNGSAGTKPVHRQLRTAETTMKLSPHRLERVTI